MVDRFMSPEEVARRVSGGVGSAVCGMVNTQRGISVALRERLIRELVSRSNCGVWAGEARNLLEIIEGELELTGHRIANSPMPGTAHEQFCAIRLDMMAAWRAWLATQPEPGDVEDELAGTGSAMRQFHHASVRERVG